MKVTTLRKIVEPTNGAVGAIAHSFPYTVTVSIEGAADFLYHRWNPESVEAKARASGSIIDALAARFPAPKPKEDMQ